jgi:transposase
LSSNQGSSSICAETPDHPRSALITSHHSWPFAWADRSGSPARHQYRDVRGRTRNSSVVAQLACVRGTVEAIVWRHQNGAKWRSVPSDLGPWWRAAQTFIRWSELGVWERLLDRVQDHGVELGLAFLDGTSIRAHGRQSRPRATRRPWPARAGSTTLATASSACGRASRNGVPLQPTMRRPLDPSWAFSASAPSSTGSNKTSSYNRP